jgi:hypothetical protein
VTQRADEFNDERDDLPLALERAADDGWPDALTQRRIDQSDVGVGS